MASRVCQVVDDQCLCPGIKNNGKNIKEFQNYSVWNVV